MGPCEPSSKGMGWGAVTREEDDVKCNAMVVWKKALGRELMAGPIGKESYKKVGEEFFTRICGDRTRNKGFKLKEGGFISGIRKKLFSVRLVRHWHRLLRQAVDAPSLEVLKARLDGALTSLI